MNGNEPLNQGKKKMPDTIAWHFLVAGGGLEPSDLRVMSPTSYQLLYPAVLGCKGN